MTWLQFGVKGTEAADSDGLLMDSVLCSIRTAVRLASHMEAGKT